MSPVRTPPPEPVERIHVPGHLIPHPCSMCRAEIVRVPTRIGLVHVDYSSVKPSRCSGDPYGGTHVTAFDGEIHNCPATRWEPKEKR